LHKIAAAIAAKTSQLTPTLEELWAEIRPSLEHFILKSPELQVLIKVIDECQTAKAEESPHKMRDKDCTQLENSPGYPPHINNLLYYHLRIQTSCSCVEKHLESARLRLESSEESHDGEAIPFELLFSTKLGCAARWQETKILVPR
jgi:hypothetical protein